MSEVDEIIIVDGGNKFELFAQLFDIGRNDRSVPFRVNVLRGRLRGSAAPTVDLHLHINGISAESGSGESWLIEGFIDGEDVRQYGWLPFRTFSGLYDTRRRQGTLRH